MLLKRATCCALVLGTLAVGCAAPAPTSVPTEVVVFGTIHETHRTSERYGLDVLRNAIRAVADDLVLVEIPPDRCGAAQDEFATSGEIVEPRVVRFPEYVDVLFPLTRETTFEIVPTAGWTQALADRRTRVLRAIEQDPARADDWAEYQAANRASNEAVRAGGAGDDPMWIHTDAYDEAQEIGLSVYDSLFNDEIGPGGWDNINRAHFAHFAAHSTGSPGKAGAS